MQTEIAALTVQAQKDGKSVFWCDMQGMLNPTSLRERGVNLDDVLVSQPKDIPGAVEVLEPLARSLSRGDLILVVLPERGSHNWMQDIYHIADEKGINIIDVSHTVFTE